MEGSTDLPKEKSRKAGGSPNISASPDLPCGVSAAQPVSNGARSVTLTRAIASLGGRAYSLSEPRLPNQR